MNVVHDLINVKKFSVYTYEEKVKLKKEGRPLPDISIEKSGSSRGKSYRRSFTRDIYARNDWICGCNKKHSLFCFPCLLFGGDKSWTEVGVTDLVHLSEKIKRHEASKKHLNNVMSLGLLGDVNIHEKLDTAYWTNVGLFKENVTKNRYVLSKIIDCIKFCGSFELALKRPDETSTTENPGIFRGLINFTAELDKTVADHLRNSTMFKDISEVIQNNILDCMLEVCQETILQEIQTTSYISIIADEITDISGKSQTVVIFRYVQNGDPIERFWTYLELQNLNEESLTNGILGVIDPILENSKEKLIAQSYDGASVMSRKNTGVQARVKEKYNFAHFVHCYAHQLTLIMTKAASESSQVRSFFGGLAEIPAFFKNSPQCIAVLNRIVGRTIPHGAPACLNFNVRTVNIAFEHLDAILECVEEIENSFHSQTVCSAASSIRRMLQDPDYIFWLTFFYHIMPHIEVLSNELQIQKIDPVEINKKIQFFEQRIMTIRNSIEEIINEATNIISLVDSQPTSSKRKRNNDSQFDLRTAASEVCDIIINCAKDRFDFKNHLLAASLLYSDQFAKYVNCFPDDKLNATCDLYPNIDRERLKTELSVVYSRPDCRNLQGAIPLLKLLIENNLTNSFKETRKLLEILITIPMSSAEAEHSFSTLKRVETFLHNTMVEERLVALSMLSIERKIVMETLDFNDKVIDKFAAKKNHRIDLINSSEYHPVPSNRVGVGILNCQENTRQSDKILSLHIQQEPINPSQHGYLPVKFEVNHDDEECDGINVRGYHMLSNQLDLDDDRRCPDCGKMFGSVQNRRRHQNKIHAKNGRRAQTMGLRSPLNVIAESEDGQSETKHAPNNSSDIAAATSEPDTTGDPKYDSDQPENSAKYFTETKYLINGSDVSDEKAENMEITTHHPSEDMEIDEKTSIIILPVKEEPIETKNDDTSQTAAKD